MPPRYSYWTILAGGLPTAFRAAERADLLPTFNRIKEKHSDAQMKWFARGRLWDSPEESLADLERGRIRRDRDWRPGGDHRDPRAIKTKRPRGPGRRVEPSHDGGRREPSPSTSPRNTGRSDYTRRTSTKPSQTRSRPAQAHPRSSRPPKRRPR